jgi:hypothetical protein
LGDADMRLGAQPAECCMNVNIIVALRTQNDLRLGVTYQRVVPAYAGTHTSRIIVWTPEQRPFFTFEARADGSLRSQGRPAASLCEARTELLDFRAAALTHEKRPAAGWVQPPGATDLRLWRESLEHAEHDGADKRDC